MIEKYVGRIVEIIYRDSNGKFSKRKIEVRSICGDVVKALCLEQRAPRIFKIENILAVLPVMRRSG
jgi:predicted DNA-binding transcriptional regulator YafY